MKKNILFISTSTNFWDSLDSVYRSFIEDDKYNVSVISTSCPRFSQASIKENITFFNQLNIKAYSDDKISLQETNPEIIFRDTPYCYVLPECLQAHNLVNLPSNPKICHIPYGMLLGVVEPLCFAPPFFDYCWKVFIDSEDKKNLIGQFYNEDILNEKFIVSGYPKHDYYLKHKSNNNKNTTKKVIWAPHWSVAHYNFQGAAESNFSRGYSNFLSHKDLFLELLDKYTNIEIIFKPHPLLSTVLSKYKYMSMDEIEDYKKKFSNKKNGFVQEYGSYMDLFISSSALITDCSSFLGEYLPSEKPVLHLKRSDSPPFNKIGQTIIDSYYGAEHSSDIEKFLDDVVLGDKDPMLKNRKLAIEKALFINKYGAGKFIKDYIDKTI